MFSLPVSAVEWQSLMESKSRVYDEFGSLMSPQKELLQSLYHYLRNRAKPVATFSAPPASGKTHVISLLAHYLLNEQVKCCIVVPNDELKTDFLEQHARVKYDQHPNILSLAEYLKKLSCYDVAIVDEAHNLRSAYELNPDIVQTFILDKNDAHFHNISYRFLKQKQFMATILSTEDCTDILRTLSQYPRFRLSAIKIKKRLSKWIGFMIVNENECKIKFMHADPSRRSLIPAKSLILFSATPLDTQELEFYCNISKSSVQTFTLQSKSNAKGNVVFFAVDKAIRFENKIAISVNALKVAKRKSLVLVNNTEGCDRWFSYLNHVFPHGRVNVIKSGLSGSRRRAIFEKFKDTKDGILLSSSSVFWEGITIRDLQLLIIPDLPYPEPHLLDIYNNHQFTYGATIRRRLTQGLGRIGRNPKDRAVGLMLFKPTTATDVSVFNERSLPNVLLALKERE